MISSSLLRVALLCARRAYARIGASFVATAQMMSIPLKVGTSLYCRQHRQMLPFKTCSRMR